MNGNLSGAQFNGGKTGNQPQEDEPLADGSEGDQGYRASVAASQGVPSGFARTNAVDLPARPSDTMSSQQFSPENTSGPDPTRVPRSAPGRSGWNGGRKFISAGGDPNGGTPGDQ